MSLALAGAEGTERRIGDVALRCRRAWRELLSTGRAGELCCSRREPTGSSAPSAALRPGSRMTDTKEMLDTVRTPAPLPTADVAAAIDACLQCVQTCTTCANADLAEEEFDELRTCAAWCLNCADVCDVTARVLSRPAHSDQLVIQRLLEACVRACENSAEECARHAHHHRHCAICEGVCRACAKACDALLEAQTVD
jgi:hypothetical protein